MKSFIAALRSLVLPWGRTSGQRIVLDGDAGRIQIYNTAGLLIAEMSPTVDGGGVWTRGVQSPQNLAAFLGGGELLFHPVTDNLVQIPGQLFWDSDGLSYTSLVLDSGAIDGTNERAILLLNGDPGGRGRCRVQGPSGAPADLIVSGAATSADHRFGQVGITPAAGVPTSVGVTYPAMVGSTFYGQATASTTVVGTQVTGVAVTAPTATTMNVWVCRTGATLTFVNWEARSAP
ncbi:hypothetical protein ACFRCW_42370 [Streptomyces sp. NPDC056653]|uniref:hypothetical protein n=1 Tax=Streptomyces sp. NPDC056653 TaxID=3345894 RepID=UPI0036B50119